MEQKPEKQHVSYCNPCKQARKKEARIKYRLDNNLPPHGRGTGKRSKICPDCLNEKENLTQAYCNKCRSNRSRDWMLTTGRTMKKRTGLCPCGAIRGENQAYFCNSCKAKDSKEFRLKILQSHPSQKKLQEKKRIEKFKKAHKVFKDVVRAITDEYIYNGILKKEPCEVCQALNVDAHHDDYNNPLLIRWLCREHHIEHHVKERAKERGNSYVYLGTLIQQQYITTG